ncbi:putative reverse transcriptase domain-containing protein, partial [Tanacetum coccineum]
ELNLVAGFLGRGDGLDNHCIPLGVIHVFPSSSTTARISFSFMDFSFSSSTSTCLLRCARLVDAILLRTSSFLFLLHASNLILMAYVNSAPSGFVNISPAPEPSTQDDPSVNKVHGSGSSSGSVMSSSGDSSSGRSTSVMPIISKIVMMGNDRRVCYGCGSSDHLRNTCPKMNRPPGQVGNSLALEGNHPNVVTGTFSLNDYFATVLFDSRANFSFISIEFAPLLNVKPSIVNPGYVIEVADDKKVEVDTIIRDCKLKLGNSLFSINLIPLGHGSLDVIMGMDWLSQNKDVIVCHEKVVEIPLEGSGILRVQGEHTFGAAKAFMNANVDEPKLSDIFLV